MKNLLTALWAGAMGLMLSCASVGCNADDKDKDLVLSNNEVVLSQRGSGGVRVNQGIPDSIEGEKNGVKAEITDERGVGAAEPGRYIRLVVEDNAKVGKVELTVKNKNQAGKTATITVTVLKAHYVETEHVLSLDSDKIEVDQGGKEVTVKIARGWAGTVSDAKDGLSATVDGKSIKLTASKDAKVGVQELTVKGETNTAYETLTAKLTVTVKAVAPIK
jgi:hypothetical protein